MNAEDPSATLDLILTDSIKVKEIEVEMTAKTPYVSSLPMEEEQQRKMMLTTVD